MSNVETRSFVEKAAQFAKKLDVFLIGSGIVLLFFAPPAGAALIVGSAVTIIPEDMIERWAKKRRARGTSS